MKISFKPSKDINFKEIFPVIDEAEYELLERLSLVIPDSEYKKIKTNGYFQIGPFRVSASLIEVPEKDKEEIVKKELMDIIGQKNVYFDDVVDVIYSGVKLNKNVLLFGKGGHNKSEGTLQILEELKKREIIKSDPFVMSFGDGLTEESLFGGINIKKFKEDGELVYLFDNSFMNHEIVIFEELFDAPPQVLLSLKDILTSGKCRKGNQTYISKTKIVIGLTNRSKEEFSEDDSTEALTQRFPLVQRVEWNSYDKKDWRLLFEKVFDEDFNIKNKGKLKDLVEILAQNHIAQKSFCSPRTAVHAAQLYCSGGNLKYISDIHPEVISTYFAQNKDTEQLNNDADIFNAVEKYSLNNDLKLNNSVDQILEIILEEHKHRTGEDVSLGENEEAIKKLKIQKTEYLTAVLKMHSFAASNHKIGVEKIKFYGDLVEKLKK
jgi:hypothetical protein